MNPYRDAFYQHQADWHGYEGPEDVRARHERRAPYYAWYTEGWLDLPRDAPILDIGCGSGQFLYFLRGRGFTDAVGIDLDERQVEIGRALGLDCRVERALEFLRREPAKTYGLVAMLDIIEHFTREELAPLLSAVVERLAPGGKLLASVPNAESPTGLSLYFADITHEMSFSTLSLGELLYCHGLKVVSWRDPWPAPISPGRKVYRAISNVARKLEGARLRLLGLEPPHLWSPVMWALAEKVEPRAAKTSH